MRWATSPPSASWGIHLGLTKLVISILWRPVADSISTSATLSTVAMGRASFCRPSLGPTSYTVTRAGKRSIYLVNHNEQAARHRLAAATRFARQLSKILARAVPGRYLN